MNKPNQSRRMLTTSLLVVIGAWLAGTQLSSPAVALSSSASISRIDVAAHATGLAVRTMRPHSAVFLGDSLGLFGQAELETSLAKPGWSVLYDVKGGRMIANDDPTLSGLLAVRALHAEGIEPDLWIVELGTNDVE